MLSTVEKSATGKLVCIIDSLFAAQEFTPDLKVVADYACKGDYAGTARAFVDIARTKSEAAKPALSIAENLEPGTLHTYAHVLKR